MRNCSFELDKVWNDGFSDAGDREEEGGVGDKLAKMKGGKVWGGEPEINKIKVSGGLDKGGALKN